MWVKITPAARQQATGFGNHVATYQGKPFWLHIFDPQPGQPVTGSSAHVLEAHIYLSGLKRSLQWLLELDAFGVQQADLQLGAVVFFWGGPLPPKKKTSQKQDTGKTKPNKPSNMVVPPCFPFNTCKQRTAVEWLRARGQRDRYLDRLWGPWPRASASATGGRDPCRAWLPSSCRSG